MLAGPNTDSAIGRMAGIMLVVALGLLISATSLNVLAEHEPSHRYFVSGFVVQEDGTPASNVLIKIRDRSDRTDDLGQYRIQLHMHNATDVGVTIEVLVACTDITQRTTATPSQANDGWGESSVDFEVPTGLQQLCANPLLQAGLFVGIPLAVVVVVSLSYFKLIKPWWSTRAVKPSLSSISGIGKGRTQELKKVGIKTLEDLASATSSRIARRTSIGKREAKRLIQRAQQMLRHENGG